MDLDSLALLVLFLGLWLGAKGLKAAARSNPELRNVAGNLTRNENALAEPSGQPPEIPGDPPREASGGRKGQQAPTSAGKP